MNAPDGTKIAERKRYEFRMGEGEFDEVFLTNATVHIERMDTTAFWIGIEPEGMSGLMVNTGVHRGTWFFNLEVDSVDEDRAALSVQRPRGATANTQKYVRVYMAQQQRVASLEADLSRSEERERVLREALERILNSGEVSSYIARKALADAALATPAPEQSLCERVEQVAAQMEGIPDWKKGSPVNERTPATEQPAQPSAENGSK